MFFSRALNSSFLLISAKQNPFVFLSNVIIIIIIILRKSVPKLTNNSVTMQQRSFCNVMVIKYIISYDIYFFRLRVPT